MSILNKTNLIIIISFITTFNSTSFAQTGHLFNIDVNNTILNVTTAAPNHTYKSASFQINTPGYVFSESSCDSTAKNGAVCIFSVSDNQTRSISISGPIGTFTGKFCLNSTASLSCEKYTGSIQNGNLNAVSCSNSGKNCTAGGYYVNSFTPAGFPESDYGSSLIYTSNDAGSSWSEAMRPVSPSSLTQILGLSCASNGSLCQAVGFTLNTSLDQNQAIIYTSSNGEWNNLSPIYPPVPDNSFFSRLNGVSCSADGSRCLAAGWNQSNGQTNEVPYTVYYANGTWRLGSQPNVPSYLGRVVTFGASCITETPTNCVIAGYAIINATSEEVPVIYKTFNGGQSWTGPILPTPPTNSSSSHFESVGCGSRSCSAVGVSTSEITGLSSAILYTADFGSTSWTLNSTNQPVDSTFSILFGASCNSSGTSCTEVGGYADSSGQNLPLTYSTLSLPDPVLPLAPTNTTGTTLFGVFSYDNFSIAVGSDNVGDGKLPLVYTSNNAGASWSAPLTLNVPLTK